MLLLLLRHIFLTKCQLDATNHGCHAVPYHKKSLDFRYLNKIFFDKEIHFYKRKTQLEVGLDRKLQ